MSANTPRQAWRFPPCPAYDIEGTESWLTSMAEQGLHLSKDGFFLGFGLFDRGEPQTVRYRMEASKRKASFWTEDQNAPSDELLAVNELYGWEYVTARDQYHLYRSADPAAREMHTDPVVQAMALKQVQRRTWWEFADLLFWIVVYPLLMMKVGLLAFMLDFGTWRALWFLVLVLCGLHSGVAALLYLHGLRRRLKLGEPPDHRKDWRKRLRWFRVDTVVSLFTLFGFLVVLLMYWSDGLMKEDRVPLDEFSGSVPFATLTDLAPEGTLERNPWSDYSNYVERRSDWLAPELIHYAESGTIHRPGMEPLSGGLHIEYYETVSDWLGAWLFRDLRYAASYEHHYAPLDPVTLNADDSFVYHGVFPTVLLRKENVVMKVVFYQTANDMLPLETWAAVFADALGGAS